MEGFQELAPQILVAVITAVIASYFTSRLALKRFYSEKWWEKKAEVYAAIFEALHYMKRAYAEDIEAAMKENDVTEERQKESKKKYREARDEIAKRIDIGNFILSDEAAAELSNFQRALAKASDTNSWTVYIGDSYEEISNTLKRMRAIAKDDLKGSRWCRRFSA